MFTSDVLHDGEMNEARLRQWAREHYVPMAERSLSWPGFVLDEMRRVDEGLPEPNVRIDEGQGACGAPRLLLRVATVISPVRDER